jgi:hypothetical protein
MSIDHYVLYSLQDYFRTETRDFDYPVLAGAKNTDKALPQKM